MLQILVPDKSNRIESLFALWRQSVCAHALVRGICTTAPLVLTSWSISKIFCSTAPFALATIERQSERATACLLPSPSKSSSAKVRPRLSVIACQRGSAARGSARNSAMKASMSLPGPVPPGGSTSAQPRRCSCPCHPPGPPARASAGRSTQFQIGVVCSWAAKYGRHTDQQRTRLSATLPRAGGSADAKGADYAGQV